MIISLATFRDAQAVKRRLTSGQPYCGPCHDAGEGINDLVPCKRYDGPDSLFCQQCGEEYR